MKPAKNAKEKLELSKYNEQFGIINHEEAEEEKAVQISRMYGSARLIK